MWDTMCSLRKSPTLRRWSDTWKEKRRTCHQLKVRERIHKVEIIIKKNKDITKFKVRTPKYLYTLKVKGQDKADRIMQAIPPSIIRVLNSLGLSKVTIEKKKKKSSK